MTVTDIQSLVKASIRTVPDWPKKGIMFRDITTLLKDQPTFSNTMAFIAQRYENEPIDLIAGIESRGFIIGAILADRLKKGFIPIRKKGKLPGKTIQEEYELEYGSDTIELHDDAIIAGQRVLLVDDLIATGGTAIAAAKLIEKARGKVQGCLFIINLPELKGSEKLQTKGYEAFSLVEFPGA